MPFHDAAVLSSVRISMKDSEHGLLIASLDEAWGWGWLIHTVLRPASIPGHLVPLPPDNLLSPLLRSLWCPLQQLTRSTILRHCTIARHQLESR